MNKMNYRTNIGLEIHVQLKTKSKMFCGCNNDAEGKAPNTLACPVCMGFPGVLPVTNEQAIEWTIKTALALNCQINSFSKFDRKHYFYPDLPKNYQISQYDLPFATAGRLGKIRIRRVHLEEDAAKLIHPEKSDYSLVDFNRAGTPLMEIVTEPDIASSQEAKIFLQELRTLLRYLEVSEADMEKGQMRAEANISLQRLMSNVKFYQRRSAAKAGSQMSKLGTKVEVKNLNSFRSVERAIEYEIKRQSEILDSGGKIIQETRGWDDNKQRTFGQRSKEEAPDYRYFPEPDLPPFQFPQNYIQELKNNLPELPGQRKEKFILKYKLKETDAFLLVLTRALGDYFEEVIAYKIKPQKAANWILVELLGRLNKRGWGMNANLVKPAHLATLIKKIETGEISGKMAKELFEEMFESGKGPQEIIKTKKLKILNNEAELVKIVKEVIKENPQPVRDYQKGKPASLQYLIGQMMRKTKGRAEPGLVKKLLEKRLKK